MKTTLLIDNENGLYIWLQDKTCNDINEAREFANETEKINSNKIKIVVAEPTIKGGIGEIIFNPKIIG